MNDNQDMVLTVESAALNAGAAAFDLKVESLVGGSLSSAEAGSYWRENNGCSRHAGVLGYVEGLGMSSIEIQNGKKLSMRLLLSFMWIGAFPVFWAITWCVDYRGGDYPLFRDLIFIVIFVNLIFALATEFVFFLRGEYILGDVFDRLGKVRSITPLLISLSYLHQMYFPPLDVYIEHRLSIGSGFTNALILSGVVLFLVFPVLAVIEKARLLKGEVQ